jgi:hypothetical protein
MAAITWTVTASRRKPRAFSLPFSSTLAAISLAPAGGAARQG